MTVHAGPPEAAPRGSRWALLALAAGAFGIGTTEFAPIGLLPVVASDLHVSIPQAGLLVTGYALGVMFGAPLVTLLTERVERRALLIALMGVFTLGNVLSAVAPGYGVLLGARVITSLCHGAFFGVGSVVAARMARAGHGSGAVAAMFSGLTIANIGGVPLAAWIGLHFGWRTAFGCISGLGVIAMVSLALALPRLDPDTALDARRELKAVARPPVLLALLTTVLSSAAMFTVFTYITPILMDSAKVGPTLMTATLVIYGVGLTLGNWLGGRFADRALTRTLIVVLSALVFLLVLFAWTMHSRIPAIATVFAWGVATFALVPSLQGRIMAVASDAPNLASSVNIGAFNLGNALGALAGGAVVMAGVGYAWVAFCGAGFAAAGLGLVLATRPRSAPTVPIGAEPAERRP